MADALLNALNRNLAQAEQLGQDERAKALKGLISAREKELAPKPAPAPVKKAAAKTTKATKKSAKKR